MNKIVREHYPVANLPEDLREGLEEDATVKVVVEVEKKSKGDDLGKYSGSHAVERKPMTIQETLEMIRKYRRANPERVSAEEAVARIRELRNEWDY